MTSSWQILVGNLAVVALFVLGWVHARYWLRATPLLFRRVLFGVSLGAGAVASMSMSVAFEQGIHFDLHASLLILSAFFGGYPAAVSSTIIALVFRGLQGGAGIWSGMISVLLAGGLGLVTQALTRKHHLKPWHSVMLGCVAAAVSVLAMTALPFESMRAALNTVALPIAILNLIATTAAGLVFLQARRLSDERDLISAALAQSPDFAFVKDANGRFAAVNDAVVELYGVKSADALIGKTEFEILCDERTSSTIELEQGLISSGEPLLDLEEQVTEPDGSIRWFSTSRIPLRDSDGMIIGLAGVTRDVTADKILQQELTKSRDTLSFALAEMSDGLAMFDGSGHLVYCNENYRSNFPRTGKLRQPGVHLRDMLQAVIDTGEQATAPRGRTEAWMGHVVGNLRSETEEVINLFDGRWLQVRTRPASDGSTMVVVTDVTRIKQAEIDLHSAADQLKHLVRTDGLTGLLNRRAFDDAIEAEVRRSSRSGCPLSLLFIDVDRFKAYNDKYGHPAGDQCLQTVGTLLGAALKRPSDLAVRYGGEEFAAILPDTDEDGAYLVAEAFRRSLADKRLPHLGAERGYLTASIGVATYASDNLDRKATDLIQAADEALYGAKAAGRDRVFGTRVARKEQKYARN